MNESQKLSRCCLSGLLTGILSPRSPGGDAWAEARRGRQPRNRRRKGRGGNGAGRGRPWRRDGEPAPPAAHGPSASPTPTPHPKPARPSLVAGRVDPGQQSWAALRAGPGCGCALCTVADAVLTLVSDAEAFNPPG